MVLCISHRWSEIHNKTLSNDGTNARISKNRVGVSQMFLLFKKLYNSIVYAKC